MLKDETCSFLAADFDKSCWREDVFAFTETFLGELTEAQLQTVTAMAEHDNGTLLE